MLRQFTESTSERYGRLGDILFGKLDDWQMQWVEQPATDTGYGQRILQAGKKARMITALSVYSGTNSAASNVVYLVMPSQEPENPNQYNTNTQKGAVIGLQSTNLASLTSLDTAASLIGGSDRGGQTYFILPPGYILVAAITTANTNGTLLHQVVSAGMDYA